MTCIPKNFCQEEKYAYICRLIFMTAEHVKSRRKERTLTVETF